MLEEVKLTQRKQQSIQTREKIFSTALELFARKGFYEVTVDKICKSAHISKGAFYNHFASKEEIIIIEFSKIDKEHLKAFSDLPPDSSSSEKILCFLQATFKYIGTLGVDVIRVVYQSQINPEKKGLSITNQQRPLYTVIETIVKEGQAKNEFRSDINPEEITNMIIRALRGAIFDWLLCGGNNDLGSMGNPLISSLLRGLRA